MVQFNALLCLLALSSSTVLAVTPTYVYCNKRNADCGWYYLNDGLCKNIADGTAAGKRLGGVNYKGCQLMEPTSTSSPSLVSKFKEWCEKDGQWEICFVSKSVPRHGRPVEELRKPYSLTSQYKRKSNNADEFIRKDLLAGSWN
ncbi:hypothetical protein BC940DRAFT_333645 [Gongronella butleri]|nr:hypothetical protein BC940DRAFT_333645 [Gongronella butleri]